MGISSYSDSITASPRNLFLSSSLSLWLLPSQKVSPQLMLMPALKPGMAATMAILDMDTMAEDGVDTMDTEDTEDMDGTDARSVMLKQILLSLLLPLLSRHLKPTHYPMLMSISNPLKRKQRERNVMPKAKLKLIPKLGITVIMDMVDIMDTLDTDTMDGANECSS